MNKTFLAVNIVLIIGLMTLLVIETRNKPTLPSPTQEQANNAVYGPPRPGAYPVASYKKGSAIYSDGTIGVDPNSSN